MARAYHTRFSSSGRRRGIYNSKRSYYNSVKSKNKTMGKMFRTKAGKYGCYVYINGRRSHFEEKRR